MTMLIGILTNAIVEQNIPLDYLLILLKLSTLLIITSLKKN